MHEAYEAWFSLILFGYSTLDLPHFRHTRVPFFNGPCRIRVADGAPPGSSRHRYRQLAHRRERAQGELSTAVPGADDGGDADDDSSARAARWPGRESCVLAPLRRARHRSA